MTKTVVFVLPRLAGGGAETSVLRLANELPSYSGLLVVESAGGEWAPPENAVLLGGRPRDSRAQRVRRLTKALRALRPNAVVSLLTPLVGTAAARLAGYPVVHWMQSPLRTLPGAGAAITRVAVTRPLVSSISRLSAFVLAASPGLRDECIRYGFQRAKVGVLPNPVTNAVRSVTTFPRQDRVLRLVTIGRLAPEKRQTLILGATAELLRTRPVHLDIVGVGQCEDALRTHARNLGIEHAVSFLGFHPRPDEVLALADVFVLSSEFEGFGNVLVEALAAGLPVVSTDVPYGPRFVLDSGRFGTLVAGADPSALAQAVEQAAAMLPSTPRQIQDRQQRAAVFQTDRVAARLEAVLDLVVTRRPTEVNASSFSSWP